MSNQDESSDGRTDNTFVASDDDESHKHTPLVEKSVKSSGDMADEEPTDLDHSSSAESDFEDIDIPLKHRIRKDAYLFSINNVNPYPMSMDAIEAGVSPHNAFLSTLAHHDRGKRAMDRQVVLWALSVNEREDDYPGNLAFSPGLFDVVQAHPHLNEKHKQRFIHNSWADFDAFERTLVQEYVTAKLTLREVEPAEATTLRRTVFNDNSKYY